MTFAICKRLVPLSHVLVSVLVLSGCALSAADRTRAGVTLDDDLIADLATTVTVRLAVDDPKVRCNFDHFEGGGWEKTCFSQVSVLDPILYRGRILQVLHHSDPATGSNWIQQGGEFCAEISRYVLEIEGLQTPREHFRLDPSCERMSSR